MGGRLAAFADAWAETTADSFVLSVLRKGYSLPFSEELGAPPLSREPFAHLSPSDPEAIAILHTEVQSLLGKGAIEEVGDTSSPGFYSRLFLVPKRDGGMRPVIDLSLLNRFLDATRFTMETPTSIMAAMRPREWTTSIDLKDAYFHVPIARSSQKYLRFSLNGRVFQFVALPFGLAPAPFVFTKLVNVVAAHAHARGIRLHVYLDDWLLRYLCPRELARHSQWLLNLCDKLGFIVNLRKSSLDPLQDFVFLGIHFDTKAYVCRPSLDRWKRLLALLRIFLRSRSLPARTWMRLLGTLTSMDSQVPLGRLHRRLLQISFRSKWNRKARNLKQPITISAQDRVQLWWWGRPANILSGRPLTPFSVQHTLFTDASKEGWGAHIGDHTASGLWPPLWRRMPINWLELEAIRRALLAFRLLLANSHVLVMCDNKTAVAYINKLGGTRSKRLFLLTRRIILWCHNLNIWLRSRHIPGILNVKADYLSRRSQIIGTEWSLHPSVAKTIWERWGQPHIDLFATRDNFKIPTFVSPFPDPMAWETDALALSWNGMWAYAFPPFPLIPRVLNKVREDNVELILVAPFWPTKVWTTDLLDLSVAPPWRLPVMRTLLAQPHSSIFHENPRSLRLHAWRLSRTALSRKGFPPEWLNGLLEVD